MKNKVRGSLTLGVVLGILLLSFLYQAPSIKADVHVDDFQNQDSLSPSHFWKSPRVAQETEENMLNSSIVFNQTAFLPGSIAQINFTLTNDFEYDLENIAITGEIPEGIVLSTGSLEFTQAILAPNQSVCHTFEIEVPEDTEYVNSLDLVFLIDSSGSMSEELSEVKNEVGTLISELNTQVENLRIGFIMFGSTLYGENPYDDPRNVLPFSSNLETIDNFIAQFSASGGDEPWGDSLNYLKEMSWDAGARLAILITDEETNADTKINSNDDSELYNLVEELVEMGIFVSTMMCYGGNDHLEEQLTQIATIGGGTYIELSGESSELIDTAIVMCEEVLAEAGLLISAEFTVVYQEESITEVQTKYILTDNTPPRMILNYMPFYTMIDTDLQLQYKLICETYDSAGVEVVDVFYRFNGEGAYTAAIMNKSHGIFYYNLPILDIGTQVEFYCYAADILGNAETSDIFSFETLEEEITKLEINTVERLTLNEGEYQIFDLEIHPQDNACLFFISTHETLINIVGGDELNISGEYRLDDENYFIWQEFFEVSMNLTVILQSLENAIGDSSNIIVGYAEVQELTQNSTGFDSVEVELNLNDVYLYELNVSSEENSHLHVQIAQEDDYQFYYMGICNSTDLLKSQTFTKISVPISTSGRYYFFVVNLDPQALDVNVKISFGYGEIDDDPYWYVDTGAAMSQNIPSYSTLILGMMSVVTLFMIWQFERRKKKH